MSRVLVIIIDGMDCLQVARLGKELPTLWRLGQEGAQIKAHSVFPPDSPTACASLYTGLNPARHGVVYFVDPLEKAGLMATQDADNSTIKGRTFWDLAGQAGKRVCILLPYLGYPVWPVNGIMVGKSAVKDEVQSFPPSLASGFPLAGLNSVKGFPGRKGHLDKYVAAHKRLVLRELEFARRMLGRESWDLFLVYSGTLDTIHHYFWKYQDPEDPGYPGPSPYSSVLQDFYQLYDHFIGELLAQAGAGTSVVIASDHGHGSRPVKLFQVNELLRQQGLLAAKVGVGSGGGVLLFTEKLKRRLLSFVSEHGLGNIARFFLRTFPAAKRLYTSPLAIDWGQTVACTSDLSGIKSYYYGGVRVVKANLRGQDYEEVRQRIINSLGESRAPDTGKKLVSWVCRREELYQGEHQEKYPDVVFELDEEWGVGWAVQDGLFGTSPSHSLVPGSHKIHSPVLFIRRAGGRPLRRQGATVTDIAPTVLDLLGVEGGVVLDGQSLFTQGESGEARYNKV